MTIFTWTVTSMDTVQTPIPNYVVSVWWKLTGVDGQYSSFITNMSVFDSQQQSNFVPYDQLTEQIVIGWVQEKYGSTGIASCQDTIQGQIDSLKNPSPEPEPTPLPWSA
jgi:hypothetical protein